MGRGKADLAKTDWIIMESLWQRGKATATELQRDLEATQGWAYSTVKTMLDRLVEKGLVKSRRQGNIYEYAPKVERNSVVDRVIEDVCDRSIAAS